MKERKLMKKVRREEKKRNIQKKEGEVNRRMKKEER